MKKDPSQTKKQRRLHIFSTPNPGDLKMKVLTLFTSLNPKKKKQTPLQKLKATIIPKKKPLPLLKKKLVKKWRTSSIRKTLKIRGKSPMFSFKKRKTPKYLPAMITQRMS
jgi:hypothetical protein